MTKQEMDRMRSSTLYKGERLKVIYRGRYANYPKGVIMEAYPRYAKFSGLPYPQPKWVACCYCIDDLDGDRVEIAKTRYGKLKDGFEWVTD